MNWVEEAVKNILDDLIDRQERSMALDSMDSETRKEIEKSMEDMIKKAFNK